MLKQYGGSHRTHTNSLSFLEDTKFQYIDLLLKHWNIEYIAISLLQSKFQNSTDDYISNCVSVLYGDTLAPFLFVMLFDCGDEEHNSRSW